MHTFKDYLIYWSLLYIYSVVREIVNKEKNTVSDGDEDSNTALHLAAMGGHIKLVEKLLDLGAEPEVR